MVLRFFSLLFFLVYSQVSNSQTSCGANPIPGRPCPGGALYAGFFQGGNYMVTPAGCTDSPNPICAGVVDTVLKAWNSQTDDIQRLVTGLNVIPAAEIGSPVFQRGAMATNLLVNSPQFLTTSPAYFCAAMNFGGYTDWYLPSKSEAAFLYCVATDGGNLHSELAPPEAPNCVGYNGKRRMVPGFQPEVYWTSTPMNNTLFWAQEMMTGAQYSLSRNTRAYVRCVRRF